MRENLTFILESASRVCTYIHTHTDERYNLITDFIIILYTHIAAAEFAAYLLHRGILLSGRN